MKNIILMLFSLFSLSGICEQLYLPILKVIDGDTIETVLPLPEPLNRVYVRINGIDTPESNFLAKCEKEHIAGEKAKEFLKKALSPYNTMVISNFKWDKYGGRIDAIVVVGTFNVGELLIKNKYALPYEGKGNKPDWCSILNSQ